MKSMFARASSEAVRVRDEEVRKVREERGGIIESTAYRRSVVCFEKCRKVVTRSSRNGSHFMIRGRRMVCGADRPSGLQL